SRPRGNGAPRDWPPTHPPGERHGGSASMVTPPTLSERFRYTFDALIARGAWVLLFWHLIASLAAVVAISLMVAALGMTPVDEQSTAIGFGELVWLVLMHAIDPGTVTGDEGGGAWRAIMLVAT